MSAILRENKPSAKQKQKPHSERDDLIAPAWRQFKDAYWWPYSRLDRVSLDELQRLARAIPYMQRAIDDAISRKLGATS